MHRILSFLFLFSSILGLAAQVRFSAKIPANADLNSQVRVQFVLSGGKGDGFTAPSFGDFEVLAGPSVSEYSSISVVNGRSTSQSSTTYTYILAPRRKGSLTVGAATVRVGGKVYRTTAQNIRIGGNSQGGNSPTATSAQNSRSGTQLQASGSPISSKSLYVSTDLNRKVVYEQQAVGLSYRYHARQGVGLAQIGPLKLPELTGFWSQDISTPRNITPTAQNIGGHLYAVGTILDFLLFPQQTGKLTIPATMFEGDVAQRDESIDEIDAFFNGGNLVNRKIRIESPAVQLTVLPLPQPKPAEFSGGVGRFDIKSHLLSAKVRTNDLATFRIVVSGIGNLKLIKAPTVQFPKDFESYAPKIQDSTRVTRDGLTGYMIYDYSFVPHNVGDYTIPSVSLSYFNPERQSYVTATTSPVKIHVAKGNKSSAEAAAALSLRNADIYPTREGRHATFDTRTPLWIGSTLYYAALVTLFALLTGIYAFTLRFVRNRTNMTARRRGRAADQALKELGKLRNQDSENNEKNYVSAVFEIVMGYFAALFDCEKTELTRTEILRRLTDAGVDATSIDLTTHLLDELDFLRFAPSADVEIIKSLLGRARQLIEQLENTKK